VNRLPGLTEIISIKPLRLWLPAKKNCHKQKNAYNPFQGQQVRGNAGLISLRSARAATIGKAVLTTTPEAAVTKENSMIDKLYATLEAVGFTHPLHPIMVHIPMGMVIGAVLFALSGMIFKKDSLDKTAYHCAALALIFIVPTLITGFLDWQAKLGGEWETLIIVKMVLGLVLTGLLTTVVILKSKGATPKKLLIFYLLCLACAGGLGFSGGELVYG